MRVCSAFVCALLLNSVGRVLASPDLDDTSNITNNSDDEKAPEASDAIRAVDAELKELEGQQLPEELTLETFDAATSESLTLVEFYSPYCSHCKKLAPVWKEAYFATVDEQRKSNIFMRQVNCVESGDLCSRENVRFYPDLRLYAPDKKAEQAGPLLRFVDLYPNSLSRTVDNIGKYLKSAVAEFDLAALDMPSLSEQMDVDLAFKVIAGEANEPYFVALFLSSNKDWERAKFLASCLDCHKHSQAWDRMSNLVATSARTAHLNCHTHPLICEKLGYPELGSGAKLLVPRYMMFAPKKTGLIRFDYKGDLSVRSMREFVVKLAENIQYKDTTTRGLEVLNLLKKELPEGPQDVYYPLSNKMKLVLYFDLETVTPEDKAILPYLLEDVTKLPFDISLAICHSENLNQRLEKQAIGLVNYVNSDETFANIEFDRNLHLAMSLTAKPTLYIFKENSLIPAIYQNFALEDMRNEKKIKSFIRKNLYPLYGELSPKTYNAYFLGNDQKNQENDKVVITFLNTGDATKIKNTLYNLSMTAHQYYAEKSRFYFDSLLQQRDKKSQRVAKLKENDAKTTEIISEMRQEVPHLFSHNEALFTYVDMVKYPDFARDYGLNIDGKEYQSGDTIIVTKTQRVYWDQDFRGAQLTSNRQTLREVLKYLLSPELVSEQVKLTSKLVGSPYHRNLRGADYVHQHGVLGYVLFILLAFFAFHVARKLIRKPVNKRGGILGNVFAKSD